MEKITKDNLLSQSKNILLDNLEQLKAIFPQIFRDGKIDKEELLSILGNNVETEDEYYRFTWAGKNMARREANKPSTATLRPDKASSKDWETTQNIFIEGDNLEVLKLLQKSYASKIKLIYIDPPYNTGKDFVYKDNYNDNLGNYLSITGQVDEDGKRINTNSESNGRYHSNWLNMIYPRLKLARNLMTDDGVIFISIDDNEQANLKKIGEDVFGEENFLGQIIIQTATDNNPTQINTEHEYMLSFAKAKDKLNKWFAPSSAAQKIQMKFEELKLKYKDDLLFIQTELRAWIKKEKDNLPKVTHYDNVDEKGVFHDGDIANTIFGGYKYEILHPLSKVPCKIPEKGFRYPKDTLLKMIENNDILFGEDETTLIKPKKRLSDAKDILRTIIYEDGRSSTKEVDNLIGRGVFENPKSKNIIQRILTFTTFRDSLILDFFAGSGTTAHATIQLNSEDGGNRKFICIQLPEPTDEKSEAHKAGYKTISEITKERIRRAGEKIKSEMKEDLFSEQGKTLDVGFRAFKLDSSNIRAWDGNPDALEDNLFNAGSNIKVNRTEEDVLYEILLKYGLDLTMPIEQKELAGKQVFNIGMGALFICLGDTITTAVAEGIGKWKDELQPATSKVIFKDTGFTDVEKTNSMQILKRYGINEVNTI